MSVKFSLNLLSPEQIDDRTNPPKKLSYRFVRDGYVKENFKVTPKMSTYLVAFHVSDLKVAKESDESDESLPRIKMYAQPGYENMTK